jgi:regulator of sigma D
MAAVIDSMSRSASLIDELREERSAVWSLYCKIAEMKPFSNVDKLKPVLAEFSQLLIDYVSLGHFGVYEHLLHEQKVASPELSFANSIYPKFSSTTEQAIEFSEEYDVATQNIDTFYLAQDLSILGENLAERMEIEDRLCSILNR